MIGELMATLDEQDVMRDLEMEMIDPQARYDMGGAQPIFNPVSASMPQAGGKELPSANGALARLVEAQRQQKMGVRPKPGLKDHSDQFESGYNWHESGGV